MSERTDALYQGGFLLAALAVVGGDRVGGAARRGVLGAVLSLAPLRWVGRISYGLYLWHWPVYLTLTGTRTGLDGIALLALRLAVSVAFATLSYYLLELPIRAGTSACRKPQIVAPVAAVALVGRGVRHHHRWRRLGRRPTTCARCRARAARSRWPWRRRPTRRCRDRRRRGRRGRTPTKVLLVGRLGRGHARPRVPDQSGPSNNLCGVEPRRGSAAGCSTAGSVYEGGELEPVDPELRLAGPLAPTTSTTFKPNIVVMLVGAWDILDRKVDGQTRASSAPSSTTRYVPAAARRGHALPGVHRAPRWCVLTTPFFSAPELVGEERALVARVRPVARRPHQLALPRLPGRRTRVGTRSSTSTGTCRPAASSPTRSTGSQVRGDGVHFTPQGADVRRQVARAPAQAGRRGRRSRAPTTNTVQLRLAAPLAE